jgi:hypothetical protein
MLAQREERILEDIAHISLGADDVATETVQADQRPAGLRCGDSMGGLSLLLAADNNFVLAIRLPSGTFKSLSRKYF